MKKRSFGLLATVVALIVGLVLGGIVMSTVANQGSLFGTASSSRSTKMTEAVKREEQVVLLSLGVQGITEITASSSVFGKTIPFSERSAFLQYSYRAKLGIEGQDVKVESTGKNAYRVTVPEFIFIGHSEEEFKTALKRDGILSWTTPQIDTAEAVGEVLNADTQSDLVDKNRDQLQEQAKTFYSAIIKGIEPDATVDFVYTQPTK